MIPIAKPIFDEEMENAAINALRNEKAVLGESVFKFEEEFAKYCGVEFAISTSSGTAAIEVAILASGIDHKEIITCPTSFIATSNAIIHANSKPVYADSNYEDNNIDANKIGERINAKTKAILPIHIYGFPADMDEINEIAEKNNLIVIEDACQAHGSEYKNKKTGGLGDLGCFSFYTTKNMTVGGDGGMITTDNEKFAKIAAKIRDCGRISQYKHDIIGYTYRLNTINAAIGRIQLKKLDQWNNKRREIAKIYKKELGHIKNFIIPKEKEDRKGSIHLYACKTKKRDELGKYLKTNGIQTSKNYPFPIHLQPIYKKLFGYSIGDYPNSEKISNEVICIPVHPSLKKNEIDTIIKEVKGFFNE